MAATEVVEGCGVLRGLAEGRFLEWGQGLVG